MFRLISFLISMCFHILIGVFLLLRDETETPEEPLVGNEPLPVQVHLEKPPAEKGESSVEDELTLNAESSQRDVNKQIHYEVAQKKEESSEEKFGTNTSSADLTEGMAGQIVQDKRDRIAVPRLVVTNLTPRLTQQLIQAKHLIPLVEVRDPLRDTEKILLIQATGSGYQCRPAQPEELVNVSHRALPINFAVERTIRNSLAQSPAYSQGNHPVRLYISNRTDQLIASRQQAAVQRSGNPARTATTYGHFVVGQGGVDFAVDQVK
tara:strand:- start:20831 stop:21625 length:795 start_codon:yes stop_codon:yes gene_type:complete